MPQSEQFQRMIRIFTLAFLCNELQSNLITPSSQLSSVGHIFTAEEHITYASIEESKHHASIRLKALDKNFGEGHICSGALIASSAVITAAECTFDYINNIQRHPSELSVVMGTQNRYQRMKHTLVYDVTHLYIPLTFDSQSLRDNIAILMLNRDIFENFHIKPISIKLDSSTKRFPSDMKVTSWISKKEGAPVPLLLLLNSTLSNDIQVDVGAPLLADDKLVGLVSFGKDIMYVDRRQHYQWILEKIGDGTNQNSSIWGTIAFLIFTAFALRKFDFKRRWFMIGL